MLEQIKTIKDRVMYLLETTPSLRDSDNKLIATIWLDESAGIGDKYNFLLMLSQGKFSSSESIRRIRQKIQEQHPHLKGSIQLEKERLAEEMRMGINNV